MAVNGLLDKIEAIWNRFGVRRLFDFNEFAGVSELPRVTHTTVRKPDLPGLGQFIQQIANYIPLGDEDQIWVRQQAGMPEVQQGQAEDANAPEPETGQEEGEVSDAEASSPFRGHLSWTGYP